MSKYLEQMFNEDVDPGSPLDYDVAGSDPLPILEIVFDPGDKGGMMLEEFLQHLPPYQRTAKQWKELYKNCVCPLCGHSIHRIRYGRMPGVYYAEIHATVHTGTCREIVSRLARKPGRTKRGRWRSRSDWKRMIDTVFAHIFRGEGQ